MYGWIWQHLPGNKGVKALCSVALALTVIALLWFVVFPWAETWLPFGDVNLEGDGGDSGDPYVDHNGETLNPEDTEPQYDIEG